MENNRSPKKILILSPQEWSNMFVSKHNYAIALASNGHRIYFINPPEIGFKFPIFSFFSIEEYKNIIIINYKIPYFMHVLHFKFRLIYDLLIHFAIFKINKLSDFDEIWCFDSGTYSSLNSFKSKKKLLFIVDMPSGKHLKKLAISSNGIISIAKNILDVFEPFNLKKMLIDHGLSNVFVHYATDKLKTLSCNYDNKIPLIFSDKIKVGYVGNLLIGEILDKNALEIIITNNPNIEFHFWGNYKDCNGGNKNNINLTNLEFLKNKSNVFLYGETNQFKIAKDFQDISAFIIPYNTSLDYNKGSNSHKIIEYLSTGVVIISTNIERYNNTNLLEMCNDIETFPIHFSKIVSNLSHFNNYDKQIERLEFALSKTYNNNINIIQSFI